MYQHGNAFGGNAFVRVDYQYVRARGVCHVYIAGSIKAATASVEHYKFACIQVLSRSFAQTVVNNDNLELPA